MTIGGKTYRVNLFDTVRTSSSPWSTTTFRANPPPSLPTGRPRALPHSLHQLLPRLARRPPHVRHLQPRHLSRHGAMVPRGRDQHHRGYCAASGIAPPPHTTNLPTTEILTKRNKQVGTKLDKAAQGREVSTEEGRALAEAHGALFSEVSSLTRQNVRKPFVDVINQIMQTPELAASIRGGRPPGTVTVGGDGGGGGWGCAC